MNKQIEIKKLQTVGFVAIAATVTILTVFVPGGIVLNGYYKGIAYHGFPFAWMGTTLNADMLLQNTYAALQSAGFLAGFILDIIVWFFIVFLLFLVPKRGKK
jgi:hypothetical protein